MLIIGDRQSGKTSEMIDRWVEMARSKHFPKTLIVSFNTENAKRIREELIDKISKSRHCNESLVNIYKSIIKVSNYIPSNEEDCFEIVLIDELALVLQKQFSLPVSQVIITEENKNIEKVELISNQIYERKVEKLPTEIRW